MRKRIIINLLMLLYLVSSAAALFLTILGAIVPTDIQFGWLFAIPGFLLIIVVLVIVIEITKDKNR